MYTEFFKLRDNPFKQSPQAEVFYAHSGVEKAYEAILQGVMENQQVMLLTGATGTGKSLCAQKLVMELDHSPRFACITLPFSSLSFDDVLDLICTGLNLRFGLGQDEDRMEILEMFLIHGNSPIKNIVVIIDEAQNLGSETLSGLLQLCKLSEKSDRTIQLVALARNESDLHLNLPEMAEFSSLISVRETISPIPPQELAGYIEHRLRAAGASYSDLFTTGAVDRIFANTQGRPRAINLLCDQTMDVAAASSEAIITVEHVDQAQRDQHSDDTVEMRTSMISDAIARYANEPNEIDETLERQRVTVGDDEDYIKPRKPLFDLPDELNEPEVTNKPITDHQMFEEENNDTIVMSDLTPQMDQEPNTLPHFRVDEIPTDKVEHQQSTALATAPVPASAATTQNQDPHVRKSSAFAGWLIGLFALGGAGYFAYQYFDDQQSEIARLRAQLTEQINSAISSKKTEETVEESIPEITAEKTNAPESIAQDTKPTEITKEQETAEPETSQPIIAANTTLEEPTPEPAPKSTETSLPPIAKTFPLTETKTPEPTPVPNKVASQSAPVENPAKDSTENKEQDTTSIQTALERAEYQISLNNLTEPEGDNALETFRNILAEDPENKDAEEGLKLIKGKFMQWARNNEPGNLRRALRYYKKALLIDPEDLTLPETISHIEAQLNNTQPENTLSDFHSQASQGRTEILSTLIKNGADIDRRDRRGNSALMLAAEGGHNATVELLLDNGASVNLTNHQGDTALMNAVWNGHVSTTRQLLEANADVNHYNSRGWTALLYSAMHGYIDIFRLLKNHNANIHAKTVDGKNAVAAAAHNGHREMISSLISAGAEINKTDQDDWTPVMHAVANNHVTTVQILILNKADLNLQNKDGWTALMIAASAGHDRIIDMLLEHNARTDLKNQAGKTAFDLATEQAFTETAARLR